MGFKSTNSRVNYDTFAYLQLIKHKIGAVEDNLIRFLIHLSADLKELQSYKTSNIYIKCHVYSYPFLIIKIDSSYFSLHQNLSQSVDGSAFVYMGVK